MHSTIRDRERPIKRFDNMYRAVVVDNNDPKKAGRVKVKVYPMFSGAQDHDCPWAIMADPSMGGIADQGGSNIPSVDSHVFVFFENGDHRYPVYFGGAPAISNGTPDLPILSRITNAVVTGINAIRSIGVGIAFGGTWDEPASAYAAKYPNNKVFRSASGCFVEIDDTEDNVRIHIYHPSGTREEIDNSGNKVEHVVAQKTTVIAGGENTEVKGAKNLKVGGNCNIKVDGDANLEASGAVKVVGTTIDMN